MDPAALRGRLADLGRRLDGLKFSEEMAPVVRVQVAAALDAIAAEADRELLAPLKTATDSELKDEGARFFRRLAQSNSWLDGREALSKAWIDKAADLAVTPVLRDLIAGEQNGLRDPEAFAGIAELCRSGRVDKARRLMASRLRRTTDPVARKRIQEALDDPRTFAAPIKRAPSLFTLNGVGTSLYGERARKPDGTYVATHYLVFIFVPLLPLGSYLVRGLEQGWAFLAKVPLSPFCFWWRRLAILAPLVLGAGLWGVGTYNASPSVKEGRILAQASDSLAANQYAQTLRHLANLSASDNPDRQRKRDDMARTALSRYLSTIQDPGSAERFLGYIVPLVPNSNRGWLEGESATAAENAVGVVMSKPESARAVYRLLEWMGTSSKELASRLPALSLRACESLDDPSLLALTIDFHRRIAAPCPPPVMAKLRGHLLKARHPAWAADALRYLQAADPADAAPVFDARVMDAWTGSTTDPALLHLKNLPDPLRRLLEADQEINLEKRLELLEKTAESAGLDDPRKTWHRLGTARRLASAYEDLADKDPVRFPFSKCLPHALLVVELDPNDLDARVRALRGLVSAGEFEKADALAGSAVHDLRVALLAGIARARLGKAEAAAALLRPVVERDFQQFVKAAEAWHRTYELRAREQWNRLQRGDDQKLVNWLNSLSEAGSAAEAQKWVNRQLNADSHLTGLRKAVEELADVQAAAHELAMIELSLGRSAPPGPARAARLEAAEKLFRDLRRTSPDDPNQELTLAQVCVWLGKEAEATEIFERLAASGDHDVLHHMGRIYRELGRLVAARDVLEKAYAAAPDADKSHIAVVRALSANTNDDKLAWFQKCGSTDPYIRMEIDETRAHMSMEEGDFETAASALKRVSAYFAGLPEDATSLNNAALNMRALASASGETRPLTEALKLLKRAYELDPQGAIRLSNYISILEDVGVAGLAGSALRVDLLHQQPDWGWLEWVTPPRSPEEWARIAKSQAELRRASELGAKLAILASDMDQGYEIQGKYFTMTEDAASLRKLREAVESAPPDLKENAARARDEARGVYSDELRKSVERMVAGRKSTVERLRAEKEKAGPTFAYALVSLVAARNYAAGLGIAGAGDKEIEVEALEALATCDNRATRRTLALIRMDQAAAGVASSDPDFARWIKENPSLPDGVLLPLYMRKHADRAEKIKGREDVIRATRALEDVWRIHERTAWVRGWSWLEAMSHPARATALEAIRKDPTLVDQARLEFLLNRESHNDLLDVWLAAEATGDKPLKEAMEAQARRGGHIPLFFGK